jgi:hypothetical protein
MKDFFTAVYTKLNTAPYSSFYNAISGRMYLHEAPQNTKWPYAVYSLVNDDHDWNFTVDYEYATVDFNLYSDSTAGATEITTMYEKLKELYDDSSFTVSGHTLLKMRRENAWLTKLPDIIPNKTIWRYTVQYECLLRKST